MIDRHVTAANVAVLFTLLALASGGAYALHAHGGEPFLQLAVFLLPAPLFGLLFAPLPAVAAALAPPAAFLLLLDPRIAMQPAPAVALLLVPAVAYGVGEFFRLADRLRETQDAFERVDEERNKLLGAARRESSADQRVESRVVALSSRILYLKGVARSLGATLDLSKLLGELMGACEKALKAERACLLVADGQGGLVPKATLGWGAADGIERLEIDREIAGQVYTTRQMLLSRDIALHPKWKDLAARSKLRFALGAPIGAGDDPIGVLLVERTKSPSIDEDDVQIFSILADLSTLSIRNAALYSQMERMANTDGLTKLYSKRYFLDFMKVETERSRRYGRKFSILLSDIDHFKNFNDTHGHQAGDEVLRATAGVFVKTVRATDISARYGGEEFVIALPETDGEGARIIAGRIRANVEAAEVLFEGKTLKVTVSIGIASFPDDAGDIDGLVKLADGALYAAKAAGRNRVLHCADRKEPAA